MLEADSTPDRPAGSSPAGDRQSSCMASPEAESTLTCLLPLTLQETDNPDLRDRAYVYWRLLSSDPEAARSVVLAEKPVIAQDTSAMDPRLLRTLLGNLSTLSSVYHLPPAVRPCHN